jgi:proline iminopeptidase
MLGGMADARQEPTGQERAGQTPAGQYIPVDGTRLFADVRGRPGAPALLYLHGGPGMGSYEFMHWQGELLPEDLLLIGLDQRGVLRSDPVSDTDRLDEQVLADDCEAIREHFGLETWSVLGHSFGGRTALRYATQHPERVRCVIFENPAWDIEATERFRLPVMADMLDKKGKHDEAQLARELAVRPELMGRAYPAAEVASVRAALGSWFLADPANEPAMAEASPQLPEEMSARSTQHHQRIVAHPNFGASLLPLLNALTMPTLLITGRSDLVTTPEQIQQFRQRVPTGKLITFDRSAHFPQLEQANEYAHAVTNFVLHAG